MAIPAKQIGQSQEANLLWEIARELDRTIAVLCTGPCPTTSTTTTSIPLVLRSEVNYWPDGESPCQSPAPLPTVISYYVSQSCFDNLTVGCFLYLTDVFDPAPKGYYAGWNEGIDYFYVDSEGQVVNINTCPQPR